MKKRWLIISFIVLLLGLILTTVVIAAEDEKIIFVKNNQENIVVKNNLENNKITGAFTYCQGIKDPDQPCKTNEIRVARKSADGCIQQHECMDNKYTAQITGWGKTACPALAWYEQVCLDKNRQKIEYMYDVFTGCKVGVACLPTVAGIQQPTTPLLPTPAQPQLPITNQQPIAKEPVSIFSVCTQRDYVLKTACLASSSVKPPMNPCPADAKMLVERGPGIQGKESIRSFYCLPLKGLSPIAGSNPESRFREDCPWEQNSLNKNRMICPISNAYKEKVYRQAENQQSFCYIGDVCYTNAPALLPQQPTQPIPSLPVPTLPTQPTIPVQPTPQGVPDLRVEPASSAFITQDGRLIEPYNTQTGKTFDVQLILYNEGLADAVGPYMEARLMEGSAVKVKQVRTMQGTVLKGSSQQVSLTFPADTKPGMYVLEVEAFAVRGETDVTDNKKVFGSVRVSGATPTVPTQQPVQQQPSTPTMIACGNIQCRSNQDCIATQVKKKKSKFWKRASYQILYSCADKPKPVPPPTPVTPTPTDTTWTFLPEYQPGESVYEGVSSYDTPTQTAVSPTPVGPQPSTPLASPPSPTPITQTPVLAPVTPTPAPQPVQPAAPTPAPVQQAPQPMLTTVTTTPQGEYVSTETSTSTTTLPEGFGV